MLTFRLPPTRLFIGDDFVDAADGATFPAVNPATGETLATVAAGGAQDVALAASVARRAFDEVWSHLPPGERGRILGRIADGIEARRDELAALETANTGKPIRDTAGGEIAEAADWFRYFGGLTRELRGAVIPGDHGCLNYTRREPMGVVGLIAPWNYPLVIAAMKAAPALAAGNAIILKPAEESPLTTLALAEIASDAGLPAGVLNVITGFGPSAGRALVEHPGVDMISFTGSTEVGCEILGRAGVLVKPVTAELGGKSPIVVFEDADIDRAAATTAFSFCTNHGQLCAAGTRLVVAESVVDAFLARIVNQLQGLRIGDPADPEVQIGCLISRPQFERVDGFVSRAREAGAQVIVGGARLVVPELERAHFYEPTVVAPRDPRDEIAQEEVFGPVAAVLTFRSEDEAVALANDVRYGLAAGLWTESVGRAHRIAARLDAGLVYVNTMNLTAAQSPYMMHKHSGYGVEGGVEQALSFTRMKSTWIRVDGEPPTL